MTNLKKENIQLGATLKKYRQMLQDLTNQKKGGGTVNMLDNMGLNMKNMQSATSMKQGGGMSQIGKGRLNRSESGSSMMSSIATHANQIDQVKIERLLTVFNLM
jgi:hypothetical protein